MLNLKTDYGAVGDGIHDDTAAVNSWLAAMLSTGAKGHVPTGHYKMTQRLLFVNPPNMGNTFVIEGEGAYKSIFDLSAAPTNQGPQVHFYTNGLTSSYLTLRDIGFVSSTPMTLAAVGLEDLSDNLGNISFQNCYFGNGNTTNSQNAISLQLNYVFDSVFTNCVAVGKVGYGTALDLRRSVFNTFVGGSYSNAHFGIRFRDSGSIANSFTSYDIENVDYGIRCESGSAERNRFTAGYMDIWRPDLGVTGQGYPVSSVACGTGYLTIDQPDITARSPAPVIDPGHSQNVILKSS